MGNDKQIKEIVEKTKAAFLPEVIANPEGKPELYSLEKEYAKTRKNTPFVLYLFVAGFIVLVLVISVIFISYIESRSQKIPIDIKDFEDLKLKELVESSRKNESRVDQIRREISELESNRTDAVDRINAEFDRLKDSLMIQDISEESRKTQLADLEKSRAKKLKNIEDNYNSKKDPKEKEIRDIQLSIQASGDGKGKAGKYKDIFAGEGKIQDMERRRLANEYDAKLRAEKAENKKEQEEITLLYNPIFKEKKLLDLIQKPIIDTKAKDQYFSNVSDDIAIENVAKKDQLAKLSEDMKNELLITGRLRTIPYRNSVQNSVLHADSLARQIFNNVDSITQKLVSVIQEKNLSLKHYGYAFEYMTKSQQENGYILDPRDKTKIGVFIGKVHKVKQGDIAYVFRTDDQYIATIRFKNNQKIFVGELVDLAPNREIKPLDKLMFKMEREKK